MKMSTQATLLLTLGVATGVAAKEQQPDILWIVTDDQRADSISCYNRFAYGTNNNPLGPVESPNVDRLAAEGVFFPNAYCQSPGCAPSRASMLTGRYPHHSGVYGFQPHHANSEHWKENLPQVLNKAGYQTFQAGKLGVRTLGWDGNRFNWKKSRGFQTAFRKRDTFFDNHLTEWTKAGHGRTGDVFYFPDGHTETVYTEGSPAELEQGKAIDRKLDILRWYADWGALIIGGVSPQPKERSRDGQYALQVAKYLGNANRTYTTDWGTEQQGPTTEKPLFAHVGFDFPHTPVLPPKEFRDRFKGHTYTVPAFSMEEVLKNPPQLQLLYEKGKCDDFTDAAKQQMIQNYYAFCAYGDWAIGELVTAFKEYCAKSERPWLIIYVCGDQGWHLNDHGKISKLSPWDTCMRTPMIVVSSDRSKYPPGKISEALAELVDIAPTVLAAAGVDTGTPSFSHLDGVDLAKVADGSQSRDYVIGECDHQIGHRGYLRTKRFSFSMRTRPTMEPGKDFKWALTASRKDVELALYDLRTDPLERNNVADDEQYVKVANWFRQKLQNILLGDGRVECAWTEGTTGKVYYSNFAPDADNKKIELPESIVPKVTLP